VAVDADFHRSVVVASGSPLLLRLYDAIAEVLTESIHQTATIPADHRILGAHVVSRAGDPEVASQASYALIETVKQSPREPSDPASST
jgi:DNA-binding FadR family transcriptional regulator